MRRRSPGKYANHERSASSSVGLLEPSTSLTAVGLMVLLCRCGGDHSAGLWYPNTSVHQYSPARQTCLQLCTKSKSVIARTQTHTNLVEWKTRAFARRHARTNSRSVGPSHICTFLTFPSICDCALSKGVWLCKACEIDSGHTRLSKLTFGSDQTRLGILKITVACPNRIVDCARARRYKTFWRRI